MPTSTKVLHALLALSVYAGSANGEDPADKAADLGKQRQILSEGYSLLYTDASHVDLVNLVLYVKIESDPFEKVIKEIAGYGGELKADLERIARDYPGVRIDLEPLPEMEMRKRFAIGKDKAIQFSPLGGRSGTEYERSVLISMANALNHESHLARVMAEEEPDPGLKKFLLDTEQRYQALHELVMNLLIRDHFKADVKASLKP